MSSISVQRNLALDDAATNNLTSTVGEPSLAIGGEGIFVTGNWYASRSTDSGSSWTHVDPFTTLPSAAGGFCCDQVALHDQGRGLWIWILQYIEKDGANVFRIAATRDGDFATGGWYWWDIAPTTVDASWTNQWFDYPDAAFTDDNLLVTFNVFDTNERWQRAVVMRFPLDTIANRGSLGFDAWSTTENGSLRLTQGAGSTMYWGSHNSEQEVRLFSWADGQNQVSWWDIAVSAYSSTISSVAPNGKDWLSRTDTRITGSAVGDGKITFMWTAGSGTNRPHAYAKVVRINEAAKTLADQPDLFSSQRSWAYPAACTNGSGVLGITAFYGGEDRNIGHVVGARDDAAGHWVTQLSKVGSDSPGDAKWGDYLTCRLPSPGAQGWAASGYTLEGGDTRTDVLPRVVVFELVGSQAAPAQQEAEQQPAEGSKAESASQAAEGV